MLEINPHFEKNPIKQFLIFTKKILCENKLIKSITAITL